jgi:hypothetical protein
MKFLLVLSFLSTYTFAAPFFKTQKKDCSPIDIRTDHLREIRDQKKVSWCYAFTAADMLTYTFNLPEKASAADVAINYNDSDAGLIVRWFNQTFGQRRSSGDQDIFMMPHQTGFNQVALRRSMRDGFCPERVFPSEFWIKRERTEFGFHESKVDLRSAMLDIYQLLKNEKNLTTDNLPYYFAFQNIQSPQDFLGVIKGETPKTFYAKLRAEVCKHDRIPFHKKYQVEMYLKDASVFKVLNKHLNLSRMVGIDYDDRITSDRRHRGIAIKELHTSGIVARKWNAQKNECSYLIRDSRSATCTRYDPSYECLGGKIWLEESLLYPSLVSLVTILSSKN